MRVSLRRKRCLKGLVFLVLISSPLFAKPSVDLGYSLRATARTAFHLDTQDLAMNRYTFEAEQTIKTTNWSAVLSGRAYAESAFAMNSRYNAPERGIESQEFQPRDLYVQYKGH